MCIILRRQPEMPGIFCRISGPLHRTQRQSADQAFLRRSLCFVQQLLDLFGPHFIAGMNMIPEIIDKGRQMPDLFLIRCFMGPV